MLGERRRRLSLYPLEGETSVTVNRVDLFDVAPFHAHHVPFVEAFQFLVDLVPDPPFALLRKALILFARLPGAEPDPIEVALWLWHYFSRVIGSNAEGIHDVRFGPVPPCAQRGRLIAKERRKLRVRAEPGIEIGFAFRAVPRDLVELPTYPNRL